MFGQSVFFGYVCQLNCQKNIFYNFFNLHDLSVSSNSQALHLWFLHPSQVSIFPGAGNGLFLFQMSRNWEGSNFLGLEMNEKVLTACSMY